MLIPSQKEIARYLGYRGQEPDEQVTGKLQDVMDSLMPLIEPRQIHRFFDLKRQGCEEEGELITIEGMQIRSRSLSRNLKDCDRVCLMAATIGLAPDRVAARASAAGKMSDTVIIQAVGAALIEAWCDEVNDNIHREAAVDGYFTRPRFSPGYGDFALEHQVQVFRILGVQKRIGVTLTDSLLMVPTKSVTALIGLSRTDAGCTLPGCESCEKAGDCLYRR